MLGGIIKKMIRRHPHVFGDKSCDSSQRVAEEWSRQKRNEKNRQSVFEGLVRYAPALLNAFQIGTKASSYGFDWNNASEAYRKIREESDELQNAMAENDNDAIRHEIGDLLFAAANVSRLLGINPELALKEANQRFIRRFNLMEKGLLSEGIDLNDATLDQMDKIWESVKRESGDS